MLHRTLLATTALATMTLALAPGVGAHAGGHGDGKTFARVATFEVAKQGRNGESVAEIVAASADGETLVYTDGARGGVGLIDIIDPSEPKAAGFVETGGEPTSVVVAGKTALVGVNTSESFTEPSGTLAVVDVTSAALKDTSCDLGGQPDALALSPDGTRLAIAIENERDEDLNDGLIPQAPAGEVLLFSVADGIPDCASMMRVDLTGLADVAPSDPEPEFVAFDGTGARIAVSLQENNHIAVIDAGSGMVTSHFSAGSVSLDGVDVIEDGAIDPTGSLADLPREPDALAWVGERIVTANEGDYEGGSRGFTVFTTDGQVAFDSGTDLENLAIRLGHYPDERAENKGVEPEGMASATFGDETLIFVGLERASLVPVYRAGEQGPELVETLSPGGVGPEGILPIPARNLLVVASETDLREDGGVGSLVTIFERQDGEPAYPEIASDAPIGFGALSGLATRADGTLVAVSDSFYGAAPAIYAIDASEAPAVINGKTIIMEDGAVARNLDPEGVAINPDGGFYIVSEGNPERDENPTESQLLIVSEDGTLTRRIEIPDALRAVDRRFGFEGVAVDNGRVIIAVQREFEDDPEGLVKLLAWSPADETWSVAHYPLDTREATSGWVGLADLEMTENGLLVLERDNQIGSAAAIKRIYRVNLADVTFAEIGAEDVPVVEKTLARDVLPDLAATNGPVQDKVEGLTVVNGEAFIVTDNDGVDDASGETRFVRLGAL